MENTKLWGGAYSVPTDVFVEKFNASIFIDKRLYAVDIQGSQAHIKMLAAVGLISQDEYQQLSSALQTVLEKINAGTFEWRVEDEDVHMAIESEVTRLIGDIGKKIHTARSRNDQVATDMRLYLKGELIQIQTKTQQLLHVLLNQAEQYMYVLMPAFTHLQPAQPITFGHHLLAWYAMLKRDLARLQDCQKRVDINPLGSGALAGTTLAIDRNLTTQYLGFAAMTENSLDAVSDRDFVIEAISVAAQMMNHFSRMSEEIIIWSSAQFQFITMPDAYCTGSSMMPQKKNPDVAELVRGKTARVQGHLMCMLSLMKSQALAYNKDNQEDKYPLFDTLDTLGDCLRAMTGLIGNIQPQVENMQNALAKGYVNATDLADYLVEKNIPFRQAHHIVGKIVAYAIEQKITLEKIPLADFQRFSDVIQNDIYQSIDFANSVRKRDQIGGCSPNQIQNQIAKERIWLKKI